MPVISIDGSEEVFPCDGGDSLLRAGLRAGIGLPYECGTGSCGTCKFTLLSGAVEDLWPDAPGLNERDRRKQRKLACQSRPTGDCHIKMRIDAACVPHITPRRQGVKLVKSAPLTHDMHEFYFKSDLPAEFLPGQYALLRLPGVSGLRAYSMANLANESGDWNFYIKNMPGGAGSRILFAGGLPPGGDIELDGPYGLAYLRPSPRDIVCIAGGSGLSPMISIARAVAADAGYAARRLHFFHGGRQPRDICGEEILADLPDFSDRMRYHASISEPDPASRGWTGALGMVHEQVAPTLANPLADYEFYFAGPPAMAEAVQRMLMIDHKVPFEQLHFDRFF
jgi:toluene monooxygenase electron transfer component